MSCRFCGRSFSRGFNLRRHENGYCPLRNQNVSDSNLPESDTDYSLPRKRTHMESDDDMSTSSQDDQTSNISEVTETDYETPSESEDEIDSWAPLIEEAKQRNLSAYEELLQNLISNGLDEKAAKIEAYSLVLPRIQKELESVYLERLLWMREFKRDPAHRKIMQTRDTFVDNDGFDQDEALEAAVEKRKFLLKRLLEHGHFSDDNEDSSDD